VKSVTPRSHARRTKRGKQTDASRAAVALDSARQAQETHGLFVRGVRSETLPGGLIVHAEVDARGPSREALEQEIDGRGFY